MSQHIDAMPSRSEVGALSDQIGTNVLALKTAPDIPRNSNFNSLVAIGNYRVRSYGDSATMSNIPVQTAGTLYVKNSMLEDGANYKQQIYVTHQNVIYLRYTTDNGSTWSEWQQLATSGQIAALPSTLKSSYNTLIDVVQITQTATNYTLYGNRKFSDYILLYITPMVESYFRPGCVIPRSSFAGNNNGTSFTYPSGGIDVEVVVKYVSDTQVSMKYNASSTRDVRIYLGAFKLE